MENCRIEVSADENEDVSMGCKKKAFVIGASSEAQHAIEVAHKKGIYVIALDGNPYADGFAYADEYHVIDISDRDKVCQCVEKIMPDFVLPVPIGRYLLTTGYVNEKFDLKGIRYEAADLSTDKYRFHLKLKAAGLREIKDYLIDRETDLTSLDINYPAILKPRFGSGSRDIFYVECFENLKQKYNEIRNTQEDFVLEQVVDGTEYGVDAVVIDQELQIILVRKKWNTPLPMRQAISYFSVGNSLEDKRLENQICEYLQKAARTLGYNDCLLHADIIVNDEKIFVIEMSPRPSGHSLHNLFVPLVTGVDPIEEYVKFLLGEGYSFKPLYIKCMQIRFFDFENATITKIPDEEQLRKNAECNLVYWKCNIEQGEWMAPVTNGKSIMGRGLFVVEGKNEEDLVRQSNWILSQFEVKED